MVTRYGLLRLLVFEWGWFTLYPIFVDGHKIWIVKVVGVLVGVDDSLSELLKVSRPEFLRMVF